MHLDSPLGQVPWTDVRLYGFWGQRQDVNRLSTLAAEYRQLEATGRLSALRRGWKPGEQYEPHIFWDSDVAKWAEAAAYSLALAPDVALAAQVEEIVGLLAAAQQPDGYLNTHFSLVEPENRWRNLRDRHELYQAGHLIEFAVAHHSATGKREMLEVACRYADHIDAMFGRAPGQKRGYPGHEEIELALFRLSAATGEPRYRDLAAFFLTERGRQPHYYDAEARARGENPADWWAGSYEYSQCHVPLQEQQDAVGHAVRAMYLYSGVADLVADSGDAQLYGTLRRLWGSATGRRMYVTGGIGSSASQERFSYDYDLPNETAYAETCASIGLVFWASRMLQIERRAEYGDVMERALYNGVLSGVSLDGTRFFYENPLAMNPDDLRLRPFLRESTRERLERQPWFTCACCPPNIARLIASLGQYAYSQGPGEVAVHMYAPASARVAVAGTTVALTQDTDYPWADSVHLRVDPEVDARWTLSLRIPGWCREAALAVNGIVQPVDAPEGYARINRTWMRGDVVSLELPMPVERVEANPSVWADGARVALQRGPIVYCVEEADNGRCLSDVRLARETNLTARWAPDLLGGVVTVEGRAWRRETTTCDGPLYRAGPSALVSAEMRAVPYYAWNNRGIGEMVVWLAQA